MNADDHKQNLDDFRNLCEKYQMTKENVIWDLLRKTCNKDNSMFWPDTLKICGILVAYRVSHDDILCTELIDRINKAYVNSLKQRQGSICPRLSDVE